MAEPIANVRNRITIEGVDNASAAINKAKDSLLGLETSARKAGSTVKAAGDHSKDAFSHGLPGLEGKHDVFNRLASAVGGAGGALQETTHGIALLDAAMRLVPGPAGAIVASIGAIGAGLFLLTKHANEARAQLLLLGNTDTKRLAEELKVDEEAAIKLTQALDSMGANALQPTDELLQRVTKNAERLGKDGGEAVVAFVQALKGGPDELRKFEQEFGRLGATIASAADVARSLGLNAEALGLAKALTAEERQREVVAQRVARIQTLQIEAAAADADAEQQRRSASTAALATASAQRARAARTQIETEREELALLQRQTEEVQRQKDATQALIDARQAALGRAEVLDAAASATADKNVALTLTSTALIIRQTEAVQALKRFDEEHVGVLSDALKAQRSILQVQEYQADAALLASARAVEDSRRKRAEDGRAARAALLDANLRLLRAKIDADGLKTQRERIALLDAERAKSLDAVANVRGAKAQAIARLAAEQEYANAKAALDRQLADEAKATEDSLLATLEQQARKSADLQQRAADAVVATAKQRASSLADVLRSQGRDEDAAIVERKQAQADYQQELIRINQDRVAGIMGVAEGSEDAAAIEAEADQKRIQAKLALADVERRLADESRARATAARADAAASLQGPIDALRQLGSLGSIGAGAGAEGLAALTKGFTDLNAALSASKVNAADVTGAVGRALAGVAAAATDADTKRTLLQIDEDTKRKLSTAKTEQERAAITEAAEKRKAEVVDAAERSKAKTLALVEGAKAIASFASGDLVGGAGHVAAAAAFAAIGGGAGGAVTPAVGGGGGAGFNAHASQQAGSTGGTGGGVTIINNFNQPLATQQQIGKAVNGSLRSLSGTGTDKGRGA